MLAVGISDVDYSPLACIWKRRWLAIHIYVFAADALTHVVAEAFAAADAHYCYCCCRWCCLPGMLQYYHRLPLLQLIYVTSSTHIVVLLLLVMNAHLPCVPESFRLSPLVMWISSNPPFASACQPNLCTSECKLHSERIYILCYLPPRVCFHFFAYWTLNRNPAWIALPRHRRLLSLRIHQTRPLARLIVLTGLRYVLQNTINIYIQGLCADAQRQLNAIPRPSDNGRVGRIECVVWCCRSWCWPWINTWYPIPRPCV